MRGFRDEKQYEEFVGGRAELEEALRGNSYFKSLQKEQQDRLLTGEHFYVGSVRRAVQDAAWNFDKYIALYSYFSSHAHSAPMSFSRFRKHDVDFGKPSGAQKSGR